MINLIIWSLILSGIVLLFLAIYSIRYRSYPPAIPYAGLMTVAGYWALNYAMDLSTSLLPAKIFLQETRFLGTAFITVFELWMVLAFIGKEKIIQGKFFLLLLLVPVTTIILALTSTHHIIFRYNYSVDTSGPIPILIFHNGPWYNFYLLYTYLLLFVSWILLIRHTDSHRYYQSQKWLVLSALIIPTIFSLMSELGVTPVPGFNPTASFFWICGILYAIAFFRYGFLDLVPLARSRIINELPQGLLILDSQMRIADLNPAAEKMFSVESSHAMGKSIRQILAGWPELLSFAAEVMPHTADLIQQSDDGIRIYEGTLSPIHTKTGEVEGKILTLSDKTWQRHLERELSRSEKKYRLFFDNAPIGIAIATLSGRILNVNAAAERITGYDRDELYSLNLQDMYAHPEMRETLVQAVQASGKVSDQKIWLKHKDGSLYPSLIDAVYVQIEENPFYFILLRDISKQERAEKERNAILSGLRDVIVIYVDPEMRIIWANQALKEAFKKPGSPTGEVCYSAIHGRSDPCPDCSVIEALKSGKFREGEMKTPDGRIWLTRSNPVVEDEIVTGIVHVAINITDLKHAEDALQRANKQLNLLTAITRHDILNNVQVVMLLLSLIQDKIDISPIKHEIEELETITRIIRSQIEFTKTYEDIGTEQPRWQELKGILSGLHMQKPVSITYQIDEIEIYADILFSKVFYNLLDNSLRHGLKVTAIIISTRIESEFLNLIYEDNGIGILAEDKERIFNRGFGKNTGFGLFLIREILFITGISIHENGEEGKGVRFEMKFPPHTWRIKKQ